MAGVIQDNLTNFPAFQAAANYTKTIGGQTYEDWWLPSSTELSLMYTIRAKINEVSTANGGTALRTDKVYWSSQGIDPNRAWYFDFFSGAQYFNSKFDVCAVRCVRAF
jgi:hypothetical protein